MRLGLGRAFFRVSFLQLLIVALLIANLAVSGARIVMADTESGSPPAFANPLTNHLGCADVSDGKLRVFRNQHSGFGNNPPFDACSPNEFPVLIFFAHN